MPMLGFNATIDISHHNTVTNLISVKNDGVVAIIHKATEGRSVIDKEYHDRRTKCKAAGFLWGSYHFASGANPLLQVENYLGYAEPADDELICLDYEPSSSGKDMTVDEMVEFVELVAKQTGRLPVIYGGHLLRENLVGQAPELLGRCPLWYARYAGAPMGIPAPWRTWTLWQYTDGNSGLLPQRVRGIGNCDRDTFNGTREELIGSWPLTPRLGAGEA